MNRRTVLLGLGGVTVQTMPSARAQTADQVVPYLTRLQSRLSDAGGGVFLQHEENQLLGLHNAFRREQGVAPLTRDPELDLAARAQVADLLARRDFAHRSPEGFGPGQRVGLLARRFLGAAGENIASQTGASPRPTAAGWARLWRDSPGHRANMVRPNFSHVGFGVATLKATTVAGVVFGQSYAELRAPAPLWIGRGASLAGLLTGVSPDLIGYELQPIGGGASVGPFSPDEAPSDLTPGAYVIRPHASDKLVARRYWIVYGPIVLTA